NKNETKFITLIPAGGRDILGINFSPDGRLFAYQELPWQNFETKIHVWDVAKNQAIASTTIGQAVQPRGQVGHMFSPDGKRLIIFETKPGNITPIWKQWDIAAGKEPTSLTQPWATVPVPQAVAFAPGSKNLATVVDSTVYLWDDVTQTRWNTNL